MLPELVTPDPRLIKIYQIAQEIGLEVSGTNKGFVIINNLTETDLQLLNDRLESVNFDDGSDLYSLSAPEKDEKGKQVPGQSRAVFFV